MSKGVIEMDYKFYPTYLDALLDTNSTVETIEVEGGNPPEEIESKSLTGSYRLKTFPRYIDGAKFIENVFIKIS